MFSKLFNKNLDLKNQHENTKEIITTPAVIKIHELVDILEKGTHVNYNIEINQSEPWSTWLLKFNNYKLLLTKKMENKKCWYSKIKISSTTDENQDITLYESPSLKIIHSDYGRVNVSLRNDNLSNGLILKEEDLGKHFPAILSKLQELHPKINEYNENYAKLRSQERRDCGMLPIDFVDPDSEHY